MTDPYVLVSLYYPKHSSETYDYLPVRELPWGGPFKFARSQKCSWTGAQMKKKIRREVNGPHVRKDGKLNLTTARSKSLWFEAFRLRSRREVNSGVCWRSTSSFVSWYLVSKNKIRNPQKWTFSIILRKLYQSSRTYLERRGTIKNKIEIQCFMVLLIGCPTEQTIYLDQVHYYWGEQM